MQLFKKRIGGLFMADCRGFAVPGEDKSVVGKREKLCPYAMEKLMNVAARKVGTPDRTVEKGIA